MCAGETAAGAGASRGTSTVCTRATTSADQCFAYRDRVFRERVSTSARSTSCGCWPAAIPIGEIGQAIHVTEGTVKNYLMHIFDKLGTRDRTRAVLKAITLKVI
ncbi:hypothetical protein GCM10009105_27140 [Dokdonella soli]|uniref:HTH luxR-type domain-containing protein n=1 Tax=Dokdonella soli TaxID=529810 RepID=A0ABN1IQ47_9GAMM